MQTIRENDLVWRPVDFQALGHQTGDHVMIQNIDQKHDACLYEGETAPESNDTGVRFPSGTHWPPYEHVIGSDPVFLIGRSVTIWSAV